MRPPGSAIASSTVTTSSHCCSKCWLTLTWSDPISFFHSSCSINGLDYSRTYWATRSLGVSADAVRVWVVRTGEEFPRFVTAYPEGSR